MEKAARLSSNEDEEGAVAYRRLSMRRIREILRLKFEPPLYPARFSRAIGVSNSTVSEAFSRLGEAGLSWPLPEGLGDAELEARLYRVRGRAVADPREPDWAGVQKKLSGKYVTLRLAWEEYGAVHPGGYGYSWFCERYRAWQGRIDVVMRQEHKAGEKLFVDWAGKKLPYIDAGSGKERQAALFLAVLGASNYTYAEVFENERMESFLSEREAPLLAPLPAEPFSCRTRKLATVHIDYHVELEGHYYSVPYHLVREKVELRFDARTLEVYHDGQRVALHVRSGRKGRATTEAAHMPEKHRAMAAWTPERMEAWAARTGPATAALAAAIMNSRSHPALGFRSCLSGPAPRGQVRRRAPRGGLRAGALRRGALLQLRALDP